MAVRNRRGAGLRRAARGRALAPLWLRLSALYGAAAVLAAWPGLLDFRSHYLAGGSDGNGEAAVGDHGQAVYRFWLFGHSLGEGEAPWRDPYSFQPVVEPQLALGGWPFGFPFWPLDAAFGPVVAWNILLLASVVAAGLLTYGWLRTLELGQLAAALGGLAFALAPYRLAQSSDHVLGWVAVLLPLTLLALERARAAETARRAHAWGAVAALAIASIALSGQLHLALGAVPLCLGYAAIRFGRIPFGWTAAGVLATVAVGLAIRFAVIEDAVLGETRTLEGVASFSAEPIDFLDRWHGAPSEELVYLGWLTPLLALAGLAVLLGRRRALAVLLGLAALVPILLAFGTNLPLYEAARFIVLPLQDARVPGRLMPVADLAIAALASVAVAWLLARVAPRRRLAAGAGALALVAADLTIMPLSPTPADLGNDAYAAVRLQPPGRILELPFYEPGRHEGAVYNLYTLQAPRERPAGYSTLAPEPPYRFYFRFARLGCGAWLPGDEEELERLGVTSILFHRGLYARGLQGAWFAWQALLERGWRPVAAGGAVSLFDRRVGAATPPASVGAEPVRDRPYFCRGWDRLRRTYEPYASLWVFGTGSLTLDLRSTRATPIVLWVDGRRERGASVNGRARIEIELADERWHSVLLELPDRFEAGLPPGVQLARISFPRR
jgi:hypothetical protein